MDEARQGSTQETVEIDMFICVSQPLLAPHDMSDTHFPIIYYIS